MKLTKIAKRAIACGLGFALVVSGISVSSPDVSAAKASKAKLSKTKVSVIAGNTTTVKVKKASKKVTWSTSNKKVAKISKKSGKKKQTATIKGVKKGSAVITAKIGKTKLKCKVTVKANQIKSVSVDKLDPSAVVVQFTKKTALSASQVKVAVKDYKEGVYNQSPTVDALSSADQKTYRLYLSSSVPYGGMVRIKVGNYQAAAQRTQTFIANDESVNLLLEKDEVKVAYLDGLFSYSVGNITYALKKGSTLPAGLSLVAKRGIIKGIPTTAGETTVTINATDELGRTASVDITFKVYDETTIAADNYKNEVRLDDYIADRNANTVAATEGAVGTYANITEIRVVPKGGSGKYTFELAAPDVAGVKLSTDVTDATTQQVTHETAKYTTLCIPYAITEGSHTYTITVKDAADANRVTTSTVTVNAVNYFNVSGVVQDAFGTALSGQEEIYLIPSAANSFSEYISTRTYMKEEKKEGAYSYKAIAGNRRFETESPYTDQYNDSIRYVVYEGSYTAVVGPWPVPTPQQEAATATPVQTEYTAVGNTAPTPTPYKVPDLAAGNYAAEVPAGDYIVKVAGINGIRYQLDAQLNVSADAVGTANLTMPVRFANVTGTAKFKNGLAMESQQLNFESDSKQYEGWSFPIQANYLGQFSISLPAGTYHAYWEDEYGQKQYFETAITVDDSTNAELGDLILPVARYAVTGTAYLAPSEEGGTNTRLSGETLYFVNSKGVISKVETEYNRRIMDADGQWSDNPASGTFRALLEDGTYTVRIEENSTLCTIGTVTVAGADVAVPDGTFIYNQSTEFANAVQLTLGTETVIDSTGNNDVLAKFIITEDGKYEITAALNGNQSIGGVYLFDEQHNRKYLYFDTDDTDGTVAGITLDAGTYFLKATPYKSYYTYSNQIIGKVSLKVAKYVEPYESATAMTVGTPLSVNCSKNATVSHTAYVKFTAVKGKTYQIEYATPTIGVDGVSITYAASSERDKISISGSTGNTSGKVTITAQEDGEVFLSVSAYAGHVSALKPYVFEKNAVVNLTLTEVQ